MDLKTPTRQSLKGLVFIFVQAVYRIVKFFWAFIAFLFIYKKIFENEALLPIAGIIIFCLLIIHSVLFYLNFYFYIKDGEFILKKGYLRKKTLSIPIERIQSVNTKQNFIQQLMNVVSLEIDTAGTAGKELKIHALNKTYANALHKLLSSDFNNSLKSEEEISANAKKPQLADDEYFSEEEIEDPANKEKLILKLNSLDLFKIGISQNHLRTGLIVFAFGFQIFQQAQDVFKEQSEKYSSEIMNYMMNSSFTLFIILFIFFLFALILISLVRTLVKYYDFKLSKLGNTYKVEAGIISKRNIILPHNKIQQINWKTNPIKKLFGIYTLVFKQAVSGQNKIEQVVDAPGCLTEHLEMLKNDLFGKDKLSDCPKINSNPYYFRRLWIFSAWLPILLASPFFLSDWVFWLLASLWLTLAAGYSYLILKKSYFMINNEQIRVSSGAISHTLKQMELFKIQSVEFKQSFFQKRRSLASLKLMDASSSIKIPYINQDLAKQIYNYLLYHSEISEKNWM